MDLLITAREAEGLPASPAAVADLPEARAVLLKMPHGPQIADIVARLAICTLVLSQSLDRAAARAAIGVEMQKHRPKGTVLLGTTLGRELLGEGLHLAGGIRDLHGRPVGALGQAKAPDIERILSELFQRANLTWSPTGSRAAPARTAMRAEETEAAVTHLIEQGQWVQAANYLRAAEPLSPRGTNMLGRALAQVGNTAGARHAFERTLAVEPDNAIAKRQLASLPPS